MLEHWLIELVGHVSGLSEAQLKQIEKSLPATKALVSTIGEQGQGCSSRCRNGLLLALFHRRRHSASTEAIEG
jgi:hypothetical protein